MNTFRIHRVAKLTGLSKDVIRVWERRFGFIRPQRGPNRYRIYSDEDVQLLRYIREQLDSGESIGELAELGREELLLRMRKQTATFAPPSSSSSSYANLLRELVQALHPFERVTFERRLNGAVAVIPFEEALHGILIPLQVKVGELWHAGQIGIGIEHFVTNLVQQKIYSAMNQLPVHESGPKVIVACPTEEAHEVGAQAAAYRCGLLGCRVFFLGANLPTHSLGRFCSEVSPALVLISIPFQPTEANVRNLLHQLNEELGGAWKIAAGGQGALHVRGRLEQQNIQVLENFQDLDETIEGLKLLSEEKIQGQSVSARVRDE